MRTFVVLGLTVHVRSRFHHTLTLLTALALGTAACAFAAPAAVQIGQSAGELTVLDAKENRLNPTGGTRGGATVILFLSARSEAAAGTMDPINALYRRHRRLGALYIGLCSNAVETADELREFARNSGAIFTIYRDPEAEIARRLEIDTVPSAVVIDRQGRLVHRGGLESEEGIWALDAAVTGLAAPRRDRTAFEPTPIGRPGAPREVPDAYGHLSFASELIFERIPGAAAFHCSTIAEAGNGDLLCLWYGGSYESADDQSLFLSRRAAGERTWQEPQVLIAGPDPLPGNGVIFVDGQASVWIVWCRMESVRPIGRGQGWGDCRLMARTSNDHGRTWSADAEFLEADLRGVPRNPPARLANGDLLLPVEANAAGFDGSVFLIGAGGGTAWRRGGFVAGGSQPAVVERSDGSLWTLMRRAPFLTQSESRDGGQTWTDASASTIRNPDAGISMTRLANGHLVLVFNDSESQRTPLSIARSTDEGRSWERPLVLESNPGEYSYPCVIESRDGKIHVTYTYRRYSIKHVELNEDWLIHLERPN